MQLEFSWENKELTPDDWKNVTDSKLRKKMRNKAYKKANKDKIKKMDKAYFEANKDKIKLQRKAYLEANKEKIKLQTKTYREANKEKIKERNKAYREANKDKEKQRKKVYREANRNKIKLQRKVYREANKVEIYEKQKKYRKTNIKYRLSDALRQRLYKALKGNFKAGSSVKDLGCNINELKSYLESKFQPGMTWDNWSLYGWHIDHVKPLSKFDLTNRDQFLEACHYTNLQPLWAQDNLSKSNKF